jgi:hypothetical protein
MASKTIELRWPAGVVRRGPVRDTPVGNAWPSPWAINCRLEDDLTSRLRGGSFIGQNASTVDASRYVYLVTENGDNIVTENGDPIVLGPQYGVATGHDRQWVSPGTGAPTSGTADCLYRDRLFRVSGNIIMCSRQGDVTDWDYGGELEDTGRAMVFQLSEASEVGAQDVALVPHKDAYLLCFTEDETWILHGDPTTGSLRNVSREVGIIAPRAWCKNHDTVYFLSLRGLYAVGADGSGLKPVSEDRIPEDLVDIDDLDCVLQYFHDDRGVYIHLTESPSWFYDTAREQFWPFDTTTLDSHVLFGPFQLGQGDRYGRVLRLHGNIASDSDDVTWRIVSGETAEEAADNGKRAIEAVLAGDDFSSYYQGSGTWTAGLNHAAYPRDRAQWIVLWISSEGDWAFESASLIAELSGGWR